MKWIQLEIPFPEYKDTQLEIPFEKTQEEIFREFDKHAPFSWEEEDQECKSPQKDAVR
jgi:hypothetical protein